MRRKLGLRFLIIVVSLFFILSFIFSETKTKTIEKETCEVVSLINEEYYPAVHKALQEAKESILVAMYLIKMGTQPTDQVNTLLNDLIEAKKRGVKVQILLEKEKVETRPLHQSNLKTYNFLKEKGMDVRLDTAKKETHDKLVIIDDRIVFIGNHNWSYGAFILSNEDSLMVRFSSPRLEYRRYFEKLLSQKEKGRELSRTVKQRRKIN